MELRHSKRALPAKVLQKFPLCFHLLLSGQLNLKEDEADSLESLKL